MAAWNGVTFTVPERGRAAIPQPDPSSQYHTFHHVPNSNTDIFQSGGLGREVITETIRLASLADYNSLKSKVYQSSTISAWPTETGGTVSFTGMTLLPLGQPARFIYGNATRIDVQASWFRQATSS